MEFTITQIAWMGREVHRQGDPAPYVAGMARAVDHCLNHMSDLGDIHMINHYTTLEKTRYGYRQTPVTFQNGGGSVNAQMIPQSMDTWWDCRPEIKLVWDEEETENLDRWIRHFLWVHPYEDGNGRTASILRNRWLCTMNHPLDLPDYNW